MENFQKVATQGALDVTEGVIGSVSSTTSIVHESLNSVASILRTIRTRTGTSKETADARIKVAAEKQKLKLEEIQKKKAEEELKKIKEDTKVIEAASGFNAKQQSLEETKIKNKQIRDLEMKKFKAEEKIKLQTFKLEDIKKKIEVKKKAYCYKEKQKTGRFTSKIVYKAGPLLNYVIRTLNNNPEEKDCIFGYTLHDQQVMADIYKYFHDEVTEPFISDENLKKIVFENGLYRCKPDEIIVEKNKAMRKIKLIFASLKADALSVDDSEDYLGQKSVKDILQNIEKKNQRAEMRVRMNLNPVANEIAKKVENIEEETAQQTPETIKQEQLIEEGNAIINTNATMKKKARVFEELLSKKQQQEEKTMKELNQTSRDLNQQNGTTTGGRRLRFTRNNKKKRLTKINKKSKKRRNYTKKSKKRRNYTKKRKY